jgi:sugar-phosphatase
MSHDEPWSWYGDAVLFDLDGTLVNSGAAVLRTWRWTAAELGLPFSDFEPYLHGIPTEQVLRTVLPDWGEDKVRAFAEEQLSREAEDSADVVAIPGALDILDVLPSNRWAVVTSGDRRLAISRIRAANLPMPRVLVTSDDVVAGKPDPAPYLLGAARLGALPHRCLVVEDAPAGVRSARAAGIPVLGVLTSVSDLADTEILLPDLTGISIEADRLGVRVSTLRYAPR